uniref:Coiled-coil domain containing 28A n=1 Tax=Kryptolebias marmoratus TaxID=37003 RepID=A0A3Q2ZXQ8_KRYMA
MSRKSAPHSVKLWQLSGTDYEPQGPPRLKAEARFSCWTPLNDKRRNLQLFEERENLVLHWFDLWTDAQRKHLLHALLARCSRSQLNRYCRDLLIETVPVTRADFTVILPRFLSLYILSFLSPRDLCSTAQVNWHWRVLSEQDCLWADRCIRRGWFLPYAPAEKESGAWKNHYVSCVSTLDWLTPREASELYGTLNQQSAGLTEEEEERRKERKIRQTIRDLIQEEKMIRVFPFSESVSKARGVLSSFTSRAAAPPSASNCDPAALLLLVSNRIPAYELVLSGVKAGVVVVLYDHRGTLPALFLQVERAVSGQPVQRVGLLAPGGTEEIHLLRGCSLSERTLLTPDHREFWEKLCVQVTPTQEGGGIDIFCPLAASAPGVTLLRSLSTLTGLEVRAPAGLATGSFQNSESHPAVAALRYVSGGVLQAWCRQAEWMEEALQELRRSLKVQLQQSSLQARGRALGRFVLNTGAVRLISSSNTCFHLCRSFSVGERPPRERLCLQRTEHVQHENVHFSVLQVYQEPLTAALNSNRAILSYADVQIIFSQVPVIHQLNSVFQADLQTRLQQWAADQCVGDVFVKLCSKLSVYTNYLNNYTVALRTIDKVTSADSIRTKRSSLQELLLCPVWRMQEYVTLLQALSSNTSPDHPDHTHLCTALSTVLRFRQFMQTVKHTHTHSWHLSQLGLNLGLIFTVVFLYLCPFRTFEQVSDVGLFLFNDALVLTRRTVRHTPFSVSSRSTHTFLASVALSSLNVSHAFVLEGPSRSWVCAADRGDDREDFLSELRSAISSSLRGHQ